MSRLHISQNGVTIIELMIATVVFAVVLLIIIYSFLFVSNDYIKGYVQSQTQETSRAIMEQISQDVELNSDTISCKLSTTSCSSSPNLLSGNYICVGNDLYTFDIGKELTPSLPHIFDVYPNASGCPAQPSASSIPCQAAYPGCTTFAQALGGKELLADNMTLGAFSIVELNTTGLYSIKLTVAYGSPGVLLGTAPNYYCPSLNVGGDFCAVSTLQSIVQQRVL